MNRRNGESGSEKGQPFHILITHFRQHAIDLLPHQVVPYASRYKETFVESDIMHAEMLGLLPDDVDPRFQNRLVVDRDIARNNKHLADQRKQYIGEVEKPVKVADIHFDDPHEEED